jgi:hypothetical protein
MKSKDLSNLLVGQDRKSRSKKDGADRPEEPVTKSASLLDHTLSDEKNKINWKTPIWIAMLVIAAGVLAMYFSGPDQADSASLNQDVSASRNPDLLEKLVKEAKVEETNGSGLQAEPLRKNSSESPAAAKTINTVPAKINPAVKKPAPAPSANPPAPRVPAPETKEKSTSSAVAGQPRPENMPQLIRDVKKNDPGDKAQVPAAETAPQLNNNQESFDYLGKNSATAGKLISGGYDNLSFSKWKVIRETSQEVWIDIEAAWSTGGTAIHHIWSVDIENGKIKALSQAARNLEALNN